MRYHTAQNYFTNVEKNLNPNSPTWDYDSIAKGYTAPPAANGALGIPTWKDELYFEYHRGVYTTQAAHKRNMRTSEVATLDAEKLASFAWLNGQPYPNAELTENWKKITFNGFHDLAAGSGIAIIYKDAQREYTEVFNSDKLITRSLTQDPADQIDTANQPGVPILVTNTLAWPRKETIRIDVQTPEAGELTLTDDIGRKLPYEDLQEGLNNRDHTVLATVDVPALGYTVLHATASRQPSSRVATKPRPPT